MQKQISWSNFLSLERVHPSFRSFLECETAKPYFKDLKEFLLSEMARGKNITPAPELILRVFENDLHQVKVVIVGQDTYPTDGVACGLAFLPKDLSKPPMSYRNIMQELKNQLPEAKADMSNWANQGIFAMNCVLTTEVGKPAAHLGRGWEQLTDATIQLLDLDDRPKVFVFWGRIAQQKQNLLQNPRHLILKSAHPSPLSARRGFFGNGHFLEINRFLCQQGDQPIDF